MYPFRTLGRDGGDQTQLTGPDRPKHTHGPTTATPGTPQPGVPGGGPFEAHSSKTNRQAHAHAVRMTIPPATTTSWDRHESKIQRFLALGNTLRLMLRAGLSSAAAPAAATSTPAGIFGIDERWRIGESRSSDLVLVDDYLAGRSLSDRETYLQVDPSGGRHGAGCSVPTHRHDHEAAFAQGYLGDSPPGDAIAAALPKHPTRVEHIRHRPRHRRSRLTACFSPVSSGTRPRAAACGHSRTGLHALARSSHMNIVRLDVVFSVYAL